MTAPERDYEAEAITAPARLDDRDTPDSFYLADGSDGIAAVEALREELGPQLPAFIVTGDTSKIVRDVENVGNCRVMNKPIRPEVLLRLARAASDSGRA